MNYFSLLLALTFIAGLANGQVSRSARNKSATNNSNYQRVSSSFHTLELRSGSLWAWGNNSAGQLGDGSGTNQSNPVQVGTDANWSRVVAGEAFSLGIKTDGSLWAWGSNAYGQLGNGTNTDQPIPVQIGSDNKWINIVAGRWFSLAIKSDGTLWSWGDNSKGQLGDGSLIQRNAPVQIGSDNNWISISAGYFFSLGVKANGTAWAWGDNSNWQLGNGTGTNSSTPVIIGSSTNWKKLAAGAYHGLGIQNDGTLWSWGDNSMGQLGIGNAIPQNSPTQVGTENDWLNIEAGLLHSLGMKANGTIWSWGWNNFGQLGDGTTITRNTPGQIGTDNNWISIETGYSHSMALKSDSKLMAWGLNGQGQLGTGSTVNESSPVQVSTTQQDWFTIAAAGSVHNLSIKTDGTLWAWGRNINAQLGDGTMVQRNSPIQIGTGNTWTVLTEGGGSFSVALKADGSLWAWGENAYGQLGDGSTTTRTTPVQIGSDKWIAINQGNAHTLGIKADGTLWAWGWNYYGALGDGTNTNRNAPVQIGTDNNWKSISGGGVFSLALKTDGTLWAWGLNANGQLGDGSTTNRNTPVQIGTDQKWIAISGGNDHSLGLKSDGTIWSWGSNQYGQLGDGTTADISTPYQIGTENNWINIVAGSTHSTALKSDGTLWTWGNNSHGQLADGTLVNKSAPAQIGVDNTWVELTASGNHTVGLKSLRDLFCASGWNSFGQLGDGTTVNKNQFVCSTNCIPPSAPVVTGTSVCSGQTAMLNATGAGTLGWYSSSVGGNPMATGSAFLTPVLSTTTTYYVQDSTCAAGVRAAVTVTVNPLPNVVANTTSASICAGEMVTLTGSGASSYIWDAGVTDGVSFVPTFSSTFTVTGTDANNCSNIASVNVTVNNLPAVSGSATSSVICEGDEVTLSGSGAINYTWTNGGIDGVAITPGATTSYTVTGVDQNGCSNSATLTVVVNPLPLVTASASSNSVCDGEEVTLTGSGATSYSWDHSVTDGVSFTPTSTETYTVTGTDNNNCSNTESITVTVNQLPDVSTSVSGNIISAVQSNAFYRWLDCDLSYSAIPNETSQSFAVTAAGNYAVELNLNGCIDTSTCVNINLTRIEEQKNNMLSIFPNPSNGSFSIKSIQKGSYILVNSLGQQVKTFDLNSMNNYQVHVNELPAGVYFIQGLNGETKMNCKIVITN